MNKNEKPAATNSGQIYELKKTLRKSIQKETDHHEK
jgi:hypothetical protein